MSSQQENLINLIRDPALKTVLAQLADACAQNDTPAFSATLKVFEKHISAHDYRGLQPLIERLYELLDVQAAAEDFGQLSILATGYLVLLQDKQIDDHPLILVRTINQCRLPADLPAIPPEDWLIPDTRPRQVRPVRKPALDIEHQRLASISQELLLHWSQKNDSAAIQQLAQICRYLRASANLPEIMLLWQSAEALAVALSESTLTDPLPAKRLLEQLPAAIRAQIEQGEAGLQQDFPERLLKQLLLEVAKADSTNNLITDLQHTQQLNFIADQQLLLQTLGWTDQPSQDQTESASHSDTDSHLNWLEQMSDQLDQYHQHLHQWFKNPVDEHKQALLGTLSTLQNDAEQQSLPVIAQIYQSMQRLLQAVEQPAGQLTDLLEQAYQLLNQHIECLFEARTTPDIAWFIDRVESFVASQNSHFRSPSDNKSDDTSFIINADEILQSIQSQLRSWQPSEQPSPSALKQLFSTLSIEARDAHQHAIADLADSLNVLLARDTARTSSETIFRLVDDGHNKLSEMQENLATDLPVSPAREQLAAISDFMQQQRRHNTPARRAKAPASPALTTQTLTTLKARQRTSQQALQHIADQHLLLLQQLKTLHDQQPDTAREMQLTVIKAQSALNSQIQSQAVTQQTLANAGLQPLSMIRAIIENRLHDYPQTVTLRFDAGDIQCPESIITPLVEIIDTLLCQLLATRQNNALNVQVTAVNRCANLSLEISLTEAVTAGAAHSIDNPDTDSLEMLLQTIGGQLKTTPSGWQLQLPRIEQPFRCLITRCGDKFFAIPAEAIDSISQIDPTAFDYQPGQSVTYRHHENVCQLVSPEHFSESGGHVISDGQPVIITQDKHQPVAITVDEVIHTENCVFELLGPQLASYPTLRGVAIRDGRPLLLLDTYALGRQNTTDAS